MNINTAQRTAISKRLIEIPQEVSILLETIENLNTASQANIDTDSGNRAFLSDSITNTDAILIERLALQNIKYLTFAITDVIGPPPVPPPSVIADPNGWFFPSSPVYYYMIPQINTYSAGIRDTTQAVNGWDMSDWCEEWKANVYKNLSNYIINGWGGGGGSITTTTTTDCSSAITSMVVGSTTGMVAGQLLLVSGNELTPPPATAQQIYYIVEVPSTGTTIYVKSLGGTSVVDKVGAVVTVRSVANSPWNNNFPLGVAGITYAEAAIQAWMTDPSNVGTTSTYYPAIATALSTWDGLGDPNPKYRNAGLSPLYTAATSWASAIATRVAAFGSVTDNGDGTFSNPTGYIGSRYILLNSVINRSDGSFTKLNVTSETDSLIIQQIQNSVAMYDNYSSAILSIPLVADADGTNRIYLGAYRRSTTIYPSGYTRGVTTIIQAAPPRIIYTKNILAGDSVWLIADGETEIQTTLRGITTKGVVDLAIEIPDTFTVDANARLYVPVGSTNFIP